MEPALYLIRLKYVNCMYGSFFTGRQKLARFSPILRSTSTCISLGCVCSRVASLLDIVVVICNEYRVRRTMHAQALIITWMSTLPTLLLYISMV
jgi:hypothetical protein